MELRIAAPDLVELHDQLLYSAPEEGAAFLSVEPAAGQLVTRSYRVFDREELDGGGGGELALSEEVQVQELAAIKRGGHGVVEAHTHPDADRTVTFSSYDEQQLPDFARYVSRKLPGLPFGALVFGRNAYDGRAYSSKGTDSLVLRPVGEEAARPAWVGGDDDGADSRGRDERFDRQIRSLGPAGQRRIADLRVGVVGLGGTGSQVVQQLAHLGVQTFVLVDDDRVEPSNLPRLAGASWLDARLRRRKYIVARRAIRRLSRRAAVSRTGTLRSAASLSALRGVDLIVGCVDNDGARLILSELAAADLVPYLDLGVGIEGRPGLPDQIGGRVAFHLPGGPCLSCADEIDFAEASEDLEDESLYHLRRARGYARDRAVEPALMPLNTTVVGLGMIELLAFATGIRRVDPFLRYDALGARVVRQHVEIDPECPVCRTATGMGDRQALERYAVEKRSDVRRRKQAELT